MMQMGSSALPKVPSTFIASHELAVVASTCASDLTRVMRGVRSSRFRLEKQRGRVRVRVRLVP